MSIRKLQPEEDYDARAGRAARGDVSAAGTFFFVVLGPGDRRFVAYTLRRGTLR